MLNRRTFLSLAPACILAPKLLADSNYESFDTEKDKAFKDILDRAGYNNLVVYDSKTPGLFTSNLIRLCCEVWSIYPKWINNPTNLKPYKFHIPSNIYYGYSPCFYDGPHDRLAFLKHEISVHHLDELNVNGKYRKFFDKKYGRPTISDKPRELGFVTSARTYKEFDSSPVLLFYI